MPFDSPHWTIAEAIVWIATRNQRRVDTLNMIARNSVMWLTRDKEGWAALPGKEGRKAQTKLINALGAAKLIGTGIVLAECARKKIPSAEWANIQLSESQQFSSVFAMRVIEATINARLMSRGNVLREWRDVRVSRGAVLLEWPQDSVPVQATSPGPLTTGDRTSQAPSQPAEEDLSQADRQQAAWHSIFQGWVQEQKAAGVIIKQREAIKAMRKRIRDGAVGLSDREIIRWTKALDASWTARRGQRTRKVSNPQISTADQHRR